MNDFWNNEELVRVLKNGGVVVMPTDTIYGIVCSALNEEAVLNLYEIRERELNKPFIILISDVSVLNFFDINLSKEQSEILNVQNEKPTTFILDCKNTNFEYLHRRTETLAFRIPNNSNLRNLLQKTGPLIAPSANLAGLPPAKNTEEAKKYFDDKVDLYIDGGFIEGTPSRIIRLLEDGTQSIIRE